jgi:hypothetical protein
VKDFDLNLGAPLLVYPNKLETHTREWVDYADRRGVVDSKAWDPSSPRGVGWRLNDRSDKIDRELHLAAPGKRRIVIERI